MGVNHIKVSIEGLDRTRLEAIAFRAIGTPLGDLLLASRGASLHLAGTLSADMWQSSRRVQLRIMDAAKTF